jgi:hypothetical protein
MKRAPRLLRVLAAGVLSALPMASGHTSAQSAATAGAVPADLRPDQSFAGTPWTGAPGVTETVAAIMAREARTPRVAGPPRERRPEQAEHDREPRQPNPDSPAVSRWPLVPDVQEPFTGPFTPQTIGTDFLGPRLSESGAIPPDSNGAVGPTQVLVTANGRFKVFDKLGNLGSLNVSDITFFNSVRGGAGISDPHVRFDRLSGRWFITEINVSNTSNRIMIAVSSGSTITDTSSFTFFQFAHDAPGGANIDSGHFADYDTLGVDANALYIGVNEFTSSVGSFQNTTGYVVKKADLLSSVLTVTAFRGLAVAGGAGPYTPQGVDNDDPSATEGYFVGVDNLQFSTLQIRRVSSPGGTPTISGNLTVNVPTTFFPRDQVAAGSTQPLDALDDRLFAAMIKKNKLTGVSSLWTAHNISVNSSGVATGVSFGDRNASRWYQLDNLTTTPTLTQSGTLFDSSASNQLGFWIPSVAANGQGHMALGSSEAGANASAGVAFAGRLSSAPLGTTAAASVASSSSAYNVQVGGTQRWGDFSQVVVDPTDDQTMWTFQEFADATNSWAVRATKLIAPPPATPTSASPASIFGNTPSTDVTITASSSSGSGFFDPGAGFSNRLAVSVSNNVTVNSITFTDPTHITINISTVGATPGAANVTITNPDGQQVIAASLLTVTACTFSISPTGEAFGSSAASGAVDVTTPNSCSWSVTNIPAFAATVSGGSGTGPGTWRFNVSANGGGTRSQTVTVAGQPFVLTQLGAPVKTMSAGIRTRFTLADASAENWTSIEGVGGRSYCAELAPAPDQQFPAAPALTALRADGLTVLDNRGGTRACFVMPQTETALIKTTQADGSPRSYVLAVHETTLWANWFFVGGSYSSYSLVRNTTDADIPVVMTWRSDAGALLDTETIVIPARGVIFVNARDKFDPTANPTGSVELAHAEQPLAIVGSQTTLSAVTGLSFDTITFQRRDP